jgi:ParB family chromosome partitioning protein
MTKNSGDRSITLPIEQIAVHGERRPINDAKVGELVESIRSVGLLNPIVVAAQKAEDGKDEYHLVAGLHRLEAIKVLGEVEVQCTVLCCGDAPS